VGKRAQNSRHAEAIPSISQTAQDISTDLLKEFAFWLMTKRGLKRKSAAGLFSACCYFLRKSRRLYPKEFAQVFSIPRNLFAGSNHARGESRALTQSDFRKLLAAARADIQRIWETYQPGDVPTSAKLSN
jgi:hypothetical protein